MINLKILPPAKSLLLFATLALLFACSMPKELRTQVNNNQRQTTDLPLEYANCFPATTLEQWDKDYELYHRFLTPEITRTQQGLSFTYNGVQTWRCGPSALTHVQLDTSTRIADTSLIKGNWRITCNRRILFKDSFVYATAKFYRTAELVNNPQEEDLVLTLTDRKLALYGRTEKQPEFKRILLKNYHITSQRYLLLYGQSRANAAVSFIGMDKAGRLILNNHVVEERKKQGEYMVYQTYMTQLIFNKINP